MKKVVVIANRYVVYGASYDFGEQNGLCGWVAYRNGVPVLLENDIPSKITMKDAYGIYLSLR